MKKIHYLLLLGLLTFSNNVSAQKKVPPEFKKWQEFYQKEFNTTISADSIYFPPKPGPKDAGGTEPVKWQLIVVAKGIDYRNVRSFDGGVVYGDCDSVLRINARSNKKKSYAIWVQANPEPDPLFLGMAASKVHATIDE